MMFDEEINKDEIEDLSIANFLAITNKAYNLYLNQEIKDLNITTEQIPFIIELDKKESISKKELAKYLFLNDRNTARGLMELYMSGIIDGKPLDNEISQEKENTHNNDSDNGINLDNGVKNSLNNENNEFHGTRGDYEDNKDNRNYGFYGDYDFKQGLKISLTPYGKKLASKIKEIDAKWEEIIYKNLEDSNKDEIMKNLKDLAISSLKANKDVNIFNSEFKLSRAKKIFDKILNRVFNPKYNKFSHNFDLRSEFGDEYFDNFGSEYINNCIEDFKRGFGNFCRANFKSGCDDYYWDDSRYPHGFNRRYDSRCNEIHGCEFKDNERCMMNEMDYEDLKRFKERIHNVNDFRYMKFFKPRKFGNSGPFFR